MRILRTCIARMRLVVIVALISLVSSAGGAVGAPLVFVSADLVDAHLPNAPDEWVTIHLEAVAPQAGLAVYTHWSIVRWPTYVSTGALTIDCAQVVASPDSTRVLYASGMEEGVGRQYFVVVDRPAPNQDGFSRWPSLDAEGPCGILPGSGDDQFAVVVFAP